jgi:hypothetical protein
VALALRRVIGRLSAPLELFVPHLGDCKEKGGPEGPPRSSNRASVDYQVVPLQPLVPPEQVRLVVPFAALTTLNTPPDFDLALIV